MAWWWPFGSDRKAAGLETLPDLLGLAPRVTRSGARVNWATSIEVAAVLACARVIAEGLAQVPLKVYRDLGTSGREAARDHALYDVLHRRPNGWMTSFELRETMAIHAVLTGNAFAFVNRVRGEVREIVPLEPGRVTVKRADDYTLSYVVQAPSNAWRELPASAIWHLRGPSWNGYLGMDTVRMAREAIGLAMATEAAHGELHANGGQVSGTYSVDGTLTADQHRQLSDWIARHVTGASRFSPLVLDRGAKWHSQAMTGVDAQHLETRRHQVEEICRVFRVLPIMVMHPDKTATYAAAEQMFIHHVVHTLGPWFERFEQSADVQLLTPAERQAGLYVKATVNGLMRGSAEARANYYQRMSAICAISPNEVRALEEMNPYDGGDDHMLMLRRHGAGSETTGNNDATS